jgi:tetratricopeptide (TPR) repeat protein
LFDNIHIAVSQRCDNIGSRCALALVYGLNPERLRATSSRSCPIRAKLQTLLLAAACAFLAPQMMAQNQSNGAASGHTKAIAPRHTPPHSRQSTAEQRRNSALNSNAQNDTQALLAEERAAVAAGDPARVEVTSKRLIASALRHFGDLRILEHDYDEGIQTYEAALLLEDDAPTRLKLGIAYLRLKRKSEALAEADRVIASEPQNAEAWKLKGNALAESDNYPQAAQALAHALKLEGGTDTAYTLAICFLQMKEIAKARLVFDDLEKHIGNTAALHIVEGHAYRDVGLTDLAIAQYKKALAIDAKVANAHYFTGLTTLMLHEWDTSDPVIEQEFRAEVAVNPDSFLANYMLGWVAWHNHDYEIAERVLKHAAEISPNLPEPHLYLGLIAFEHEDYMAAEPLLRKAIDLTAGDDTRNFYQIRRAYIAMGRILARQHNEAQAAAMFNKARDLQELSLKESQQHVSKILASGGPAPMGAMVPLETKSTGAEAVRHIRDDDDLAAKLSPEQQKEATEEEAVLRAIIASAYNDFATAEAHSGQFSAALDHFHQAEKWDPNIPNLSRNIGVAAMKLQNYPEAARALSQHLSAHAEDKVARASLATAFFAMGKFSETAQTIAPLDDVAIQDSQLGYIWAASLAKMGELKQCAQVLERLPTEQMPPEMLLLVGETWGDAQNYDKAIELFHRASQLQPALPHAHYDAGLAYLRSDRPALASKEFEAELALSPNDLDTKYNLAFTLLQQSQQERATKLLEEVTNANPTHAEAQYELGKLLLSEGKVAGAVAHLELAAKAAPDKDYIRYQLQSAYRKAARPEDAERELAIYKQLKERGKQGNTDVTQR